MNIFNYSIKDITDIAVEFGVDIRKGLEEKVATERIEQYGPNKLGIKETKGWYIFLRQFKSAFIYLLIAALIITLFLGEKIDSMMIFLFLIINTGLGFFQEYSSEKTAQLLNNYALPRAKVLRNGKIKQITADQLVPGDIIEVETGDKIPADARLLAQSNFSVDETVLTGESVPVFKRAENLKEKPSSYHQASNLVFSGTDVVKGQAHALVVSTGKNTVFGQIAKLAGKSKKVSDFEKGISSFSQFILKLIGLTLLIVIIAQLLIKQGELNVLELIVFSVALTVSVIPEALPLVTTFSLARGARRLASKKVIVKRLSAIEDLGGIEVLCSDKTGTLTKNELKIANTYPGHENQVIWFANLASSFELKKKTEPFDIALEKGLDSEQKKRIKKVLKLTEEPFDPIVKRNAVLVQDQQKNYLIIRGAPETALSLCKGIDKNNINQWIKKEGQEGHRVLAVVYQEVSTTETEKKDFTQILQKKDFIFGGIVSFVDEIKPSAFTAVEEAKKLGVRIVIITGDSPEVAGAVAYQIGLIDSPEQTITGEQWQRADKKERKLYLENYCIFARISPEEKYSIIELLREQKMVGFLGEGINDAPALKIAGVSIVVDSAADIAREASDIILLQNNLMVIIEGVKEGRRVFANTTKYIKSTLASNFGNFFALATSSLVIDFLPMLPIQILLVNLLSDTPMISISTDTVDSKELDSPKKYEVREIILIAILLGVVSTIFDFIFFASFYRISPGVLQTNWFVGSILTELVLLFSIRTRSFFIKATRPSGPIIWISIITFIVTVVVPYTKFGQQIFKFVPPSPAHLTLILTIVLIYFIISETVKLQYYRSKLQTADQVPKMKLADTK